MPAGPLGVSSTFPGDSWASFIIDRLRLQAVLLQSGARLVQVTGHSMHVPRVTADATADWVAEATELPSDAPDGDDIVLVPMKLGDVVSISTEAVEDAPVDELSVIGDSLVRAVANKIDQTAFSTGAATGIKPAGLLAGTLPSVTGGVGSIDTYIKAAGKIMGAGGNPTVTFAHPDDVTSLALVKEASGSNVPVLQDPTEGQGYRVAGTRILPTPAITKGTALMVEPGQIVVGVSRNMKVDLSPHAKFTSDQITARITARVDFRWGDVSGACLITT